MSSGRVSIVVIGASHAGLGVNHKLLRQTPKVSITLINPWDEYYFNIAAPRFLVKPGSLPSSRYLYSIPETFREYPSGSFTFVKGLVTGIDYSNKSVSVSTDPSSSTDTNVSLSFDYLVIASGSTTPATLGTTGLKLPFKTTAFEDNRKAITEVNQRLQAATSIVIGGGGPLKVELAGELAEAAGPKKTITLVSRTSSLLEGATETVKKTADLLLRRKDVEVLKSVTVDKAERDTNTKGWIVTLSTGRTIRADEVVENGTSRSDNYALGDITCHPYRLLSRVSHQAATVATNITASIAKDTRIVTYSAEAQKKMMVVPVGQSTGTGHMGGWMLFGCIVWFFKGKEFLTYEAPKFL